VSDGKALYGGITSMAIAMIRKRGSEKFGITEEEIREIKDKIHAAKVNI